MFHQMKAADDELEQAKQSLSLVRMKYRFNQLAF